MVLLPSSFLPAGLAFATFAVLPLVAYTLLSADLKEFLQSEFEAWKADVQRVSSSNERTSPTREDTTLLDAATLARLKAEVAELRARILATRETQESAIEARCLGQMVCNAEFEAYWKTEKDDLQKALTAANSSLQAMKVECISKEAQILMLTQANQDLEAANEELDAVNEQRAKEGEDIQIANSLIISNHTNKIITLTTNLRATEAKCRSFHNEMSTLTTDLRTMETKCRANEVEVRALTQAKEYLQRTNESLEEQILGLANRVSEYRGRLTEALANPSTAATTFPPAVTHVAPPQYMESYRTTWQAQTQSADSSPWNFPAPNPDRYVRRYAMLGSTPSGYEKAPVLSAPNSLGIGPSTSRPLPVPPLTQLPILSPLVAPPRYADPYTPAWQGESETHRAGSSHWISSIPSPGQYSYLQVASTAPTEQYPKVPVVAAGYADAQSAGPPPHMDFGQPIFPPPFEMAGVYLLIPPLLYLSKGIESNDVAPPAGVSQPIIG